MPFDLPLYPTPAELEQFYIAFPDGKPAARIGLRLDFFFRHLGEEDLRKNLFECIDHYLSWAGDNIRHYLVPGARKYRQLDPGQRIDPALIYKMAIGNGSFWLQASAAPEGCASHWAITAMSSQVAFRKEELGSLVLYLPFTALEKQRPRLFTEFFLNICNSLAVEHAYAGMGWVLPSDPGGCSAALQLPELSQLALRFCALDVSHPNITAIHCEDGIKSINWLMAVSHRLLEKIGGAETVSHNAGPEIKLHPYSNGMIFQAGDSPQIGDTQQGLVPPAYLALGKALKTLRSPYPDTLLYAPSDNYAEPGKDIDDAFTQRWLARFDGV